MRKVQDLLIEKDPNKDENNLEDCCRIRLVYTSYRNLVALRMNEMI